MSRKISDFFANGILFFFGILTTILVWNSIFEPYVNTSFSSKIGTAGNWFIVSLIFAFLILAIYKMFAVIDRTKDKNLKLFFWGLLGFNVIVSAFFVYNFQPVPVTDSLVMIDQAKALAYNINSTVDQNSIHYSYFAAYSNNHFLTIGFMYIYKIMKKIGIDSDYSFFYVMNAALMILANLLTYCIIKRWKDSRIALKTLFVSVLNPMSYVLLFWIYSTSICIPMMQIILLLCLEIYQNKKNGLVKNAILLCLLIILTYVGYLIRPITAFPVIAFFIFIILRYLRREKLNVHLKKFILFSGVIVVSLVGTKYVCQKVTEPYFGSEMKQSEFPITHWIMMSAHGDGQFCQTDVDETTQRVTYDEKKEYNIEMIKYYYGEMGIIGSINHCIRKMSLTFSNGRDRDIGFDSKFSSAYPYFLEGKNDIFLIYVQVFRVMTLLGMLFAVKSLWDNKDHNAYLWISLISVLGGYVFYMIWEVKSAYSAPFICLMVIVAAEGYRNQLSKLKTFLQGKKNIGKTGIYVSIAIVAAEILILGDVMPIKNNKAEYIMHPYTAGIVENVELNDLGNTLEQTFVTDRSFSKIVIPINIIGDGEEAVYNVKVTDEKGTVLSERETSATKTNKDRVIIAFEDAINEEKIKQTFCVSVEMVSDGDKKLLFSKRKVCAVDDYEGVLKVNNQMLTGDLMQVIYKDYEENYVTVFDIIMILIMSILGIVLLNKKVREEQ